jgi:hypothetical protein
MQLVIFIVIEEGLESSCVNDSNVAFLGSDWNKFGSATTGLIKTSGVEFDQKRVGYTTPVSMVVIILVMELVLYVRVQAQRRKDLPLVRGHGQSLTTFPF